jgi:hypothetical protein
MSFLFWLIIDRFPLFVHLGPACSSVVVRNPRDDSMHCKARGVLQTDRLKVRKQLLDCSICNCCGELIELSCLIHVYCIIKAPRERFSVVCFYILIFWLYHDFTLQATCTILAMIATVPLAQLLCFHILLIKKVSYFQTTIKLWMPVRDRELPLFHYVAWSILPSIYPKLWQLLVIVCSYIMLIGLQPSPLTDISFS